MSRHFALSAILVAISATPGAPAPGLDLPPGQWQVWLSSPQPLWGASDLMVYETCISAANPDPLEVVSPGCQIRRTPTEAGLRWKSQCLQKGFPTKVKGVMRMHDEELRGSMATKLVVRDTRLVVRSKLRARRIGECEHEPPVERQAD